MSKNSRIRRRVRLRNAALRHITVDVQTFGPTFLCQDGLTRLKPTEAAVEAHYDPEKFLEAFDHTDWLVRNGHGNLLEGTDSAGN